MGWSRKVLGSGMVHEVSCCVLLAALMVGQDDVFMIFGALLMDVWR